MVVLTLCYPNEGCYICSLVLSSSWSDVRFKITWLLVCHDLANWLSHYLYFFSFLFFSYLWLQDGARESITWLCYNVTMVWRMVTDSHVTVTVTVGHMMRVTWGPWESKCIATVVKCINSREMSENSIEFSLSNSEQRDSWLNSGHRTLDADIVLLFC